MAGYNPFIWVKHSQGGAQINVPAPDKYQVNVQKTSKAGAGRTEDWRMKTMFTGKLLQIQAEWTNVSIEDAQAILNAFDPDNKNSYWVKVLTPQYGIITEEVYCGDVPAPLFDTATNRWESISIELVSIESKWRST